MRLYAALYRLQRKMASIRLGLAMSANEAQNNKRRKTSEQDSKSTELVALIEQLRKDLDQTNKRLEKALTRIDRLEKASDQMQRFT